MINNIGLKRKTRKNMIDKISDAEIKIRDANNFYNQLLKRISKDADGKKIKEYLKCLIPEWKKMTSNRLYKHIQRMHENAEEIRRFEIDLTWRRAIYFVPLIVIFFTAFGGAFFSFKSEFGIIDSNKFIETNIAINQKGKNYEGEITGHIISDYSDKEKNKEEDKKNDKKENKPTYNDESKKGHFILLGIALINACLCFFLTKMNIESQRWQKNWECHMDYLQQILGFKLMQTCLRPRGGYFSIRTTNTWIGFITFLAWYFIIVLLFYSLLDINFEIKDYSFLYNTYSLPIYNYVLILFLFLSLALTSGLVLAKFVTIILDTFFTRSKIIPFFASLIIFIIIAIMLTLIVIIIYHFWSLILYFILTPILYFILAPSLAFITVLIFINDIYYYLAGEYIWKGLGNDEKVSMSENNELYIRDLEIDEKEFISVKKSRDKKCIHDVIIILSSVIIFLIPFIFITASYIMNKILKIDMMPNFVIVFSFLILFISPSIRKIIGKIKCFSQKFNFI